MVGSLVKIHRPTPLFTEYSSSLLLTTTTQVCVEAGPSVPHSQNYCSSCVQRDNPIARDRDLSPHHIISYHIIKLVYTRWSYRESKHQDSCPQLAR